jgi:hypothetical protein
MTGRTAVTRCKAAALHLVAAAIGSIGLTGLGQQAVAQVPLTDQRISNDDPIQREPHLSADGAFIFATYQGSAQPSASVGTSTSATRGAAWSLGSLLPILPPFNRVDIPSAGYLAPDGTVHLVTNSQSIQYLRGVGLQPTAWVNPVLALKAYTNDLLGYELHSVASDPALGCVYICTTENTEDPGFSSTVLFTRSLDDGLTWQPPLRLSSPYSKGSSMVVGADGTIYVAWVDYSLSRALVSRSIDHGASFEIPVTAADMLDNLDAIPLGLHQPSTPERTYPWYRTVEFAPNFPSLAVDRSAGATRGNIYLTWADHADGIISAATLNVFETQANDSPATAQVLPLDCDVFGAVSNVERGTDPVDYYAFSATAGQTLWLDGRAFGETIGCQVLMEMPDGTLPRVAFLKLMYSPEVPQTGRPKALVFTAPRTGRYFLEPASTFFGTGYQLKLRSYTVTASSAAQDMRDIVLVRSTDGGTTWSPKLRVNHDAPGHDQCMPNVAVNGQGAVYVGWYDRRDAVDGDSVNVYAAVSLDGGQSFGHDLKLSSHQSGWIGVPHSLIPVVPGDLIGDRIAIAAGDDYGVVAWSDFRDWPTRSDIYAARIVDIPTAVEAVSDLSAEPVPGGVRLSWHVNDLRGIAGLQLYRADPNAPEAALGVAELVPTHEGTFEQFDASAEPGMSYDYRLRVRRGQTESWLGPVSVQVPEHITSLAWRAAWPNPFARRTSIRLAVPRAADGAVRVYDVQGKEVRTLAAGRFEPGERTIEWDGRDGSGMMAAPGLYFVAAEVGGEGARLRVARIP